MPTKRKLIAVIDDDDSVRKALERQVTAAGFTARCFASAEAFLAVAVSCGAECVISDIHLGGLTGVELALHPVVTAMDLPVILISGQYDRLLDEPARVVAAAFLAKPIPPGKLLEAIIDTVGPPIADED